MKKYNLLVPLAGKGQRMIDGGYSFPKPMIMAGDRHILDYGLDSIDYSECNLIFVVRRDHVCNFSIDKFLKKYGDVTIVISEQDTKGSASTCLLAKDYINNELPLVIFCPDVCFSPKFKPTDETFKHEGHLSTFKANSSNYSYVSTDNDGFVTKAVEKMVISEDASVGVYCFQSGKLFVQIAEDGEKNPDPSAKETFICPLYNRIIASGGKVTTEKTDKIYIMGTPQELSFFKETILPYFLVRGFILCSDHSGFETKEHIKTLLEDQIYHYRDFNYEVIDCGCYSSDNCDYADYIEQAVETRKYFPGYLIIASCRSGQGVNICANKYPGIRSAIVTSADSARLAIQHNAANFITIPGALEHSNLNSILDVLKTETFAGGRHQNRLQKFRG